jgi:NitT/TauT family transport system ATP-binding protein
MTEKPLIELDKVSLRYPGGTLALTETDMRIHDGDFVAIVGPSGCGKSTILKLVSGLIRATTGNVVVADREVKGPSAGIGMAFQNPTMLPWLTIRDNVMLPLKIVEPYRSQYRAKRKTEFTDRVEALLKQVGLAGFGEKRPWQLSGGMLQRASLCRALIHEPRMLLLDEPFGALDQFTREELWAIMQQLWMDKKPTVILVTHDLREACYLGTRIYMMSARPGRILEARDVPFARPRTLEMTFSPAFVEIVQHLRMQIADARGAPGATAVKEAA